MGFYEFTDYKELVRKWLDSQPNKGRGQYKKMAEFLLLSSVTISQVFNGEKHLSAEQALKLSAFMNLTELQREYFIHLVQYCRAGTKDLENYYKEKLLSLRRQSSDLKTRLVQDKTIEDSEKAKFYSDWIFSGVRLATSLKSYQDVKSLSQKFQVPDSKLLQVIEFLIKTGLVIEEEGKLKMGPQRIHLEAESPYIKSRQIGWRLKGIERMNQNAAEEFFYTAPMSVSKKLIPKIREELMAAIEKINAQVVAEEPDELVCLNMDFFKF